MDKSVSNEFPLVEKDDIKPYRRSPHFYETDQMAIVHHSNYIRWFEEARVDFMNQIGFSYKKAADLGIDFAVLSVNCQYRSMVRFGDNLIIKTYISRFSASRMTVSYKILDEETGELRTTGESGHCYIDRQTQRPVSLKKKIPPLFSLFEHISGNEE